MTQNPSRIHHFIPIFWSKWWKDESGRVQRFTRPYVQVVDRLVAPARCGFAQDLYTVPDAGVHSQILEELFFKKLDDIASRALAKLNAFPTTPLNEAETSAWAGFVQSLFHRSPENLRVVKLAGNCSRGWQKSLAWRSVG